MITEKEDPALVAAKKLQQATAALRALPDRNYADEQKPEYKAALEREKEADFAFSTAPVTSLAGALVKLRALAKDIVEDGGSEDWCLGHVNTVAAFLEGAPAPAPKPDPVVVLFGTWLAFQDEAMALEKADPEEADPQNTDQRDELYNRQNKVERQIIDTPATSIGGISAKLRILAHYEFPYRGVFDPPCTPAKDTDFEGIIRAWRAEAGMDGAQGLDWQGELLIGSLRDAERLAGAS